MRRGTRSRVKRKRTYTRRGGTRSAITKRQRGFVRTGGYYGRYPTRSTGELKFLDTVIDDAVIATGGTIQNTGTIHVIPQGVTETTRIGRKCTIKQINFRWTAKLPQATAATDIGDTVRIIMYLDKQCNGATATIANILETSVWNGWNNLENSLRFRILYDTTISLYAPSGGSSAVGTHQFGPMVKNGAFYKKCNIPIEFDASASTGAIGTIRSNNVGLLFISEGGFAGIQSNVRVRFSDH